MRVPSAVLGPCCLACAHAEQLLDHTGLSCPKDGGDAIERRTRRGRTFYGCSNYPARDFASWDRPLQEPCLHCAGLQVALSGKLRGQRRCTACGRMSDMAIEDATEGHDGVEILAIGMSQQASLPLEPAVEALVGAL